jgi:hypothetical protein
MDVLHLLENKVYPVVSALVGQAFEPDSDLSPDGCG